MATLTITGTGSNDKKVQTYVPYATYTSAAVVTVSNGTEVGIRSATTGVTLDGVVKVASGWWDFTVTQDLWIDLSADPIAVTTYDPNAVSIGHKTMINGELLTVKMGKAMVGGTVRSIVKGKVLLNGTVHEIPFEVAAKIVEINVTGSGNSSYCHVTINGTKYYSAQSCELEDTDSITILASGDSTNNRNRSKVVLNGTTVAQGASGVAASYTLELKGLSTVNIALSYNGSSTITITTE